MLFPYCRSAELITEGFARELVSKIQNLRKESGFDVADRITITLKHSACDNAVAEFNDYISLKPRHSNVRSGIWYLKVSYRVTDIKNVEFHQNAIEKAFDVGRVSFTGNATFDAKRDLDRIKVPPKFVIYGIRNFSLAKFEIFKNK